MEKKLGLALKWYEKPIYSVLLRMRRELPVFIVWTKCPVTGEILDKDLAVLKPAKGPGRRINIFKMNLYSAIGTRGAQRVTFGLDTEILESGVKTDPARKVMVELEHIGYSTDLKFSRTKWSFDRKNI